MVAPDSTLTLSEFLATHGENDRYELLKGNLIDLDPTDDHEATLAFLDQQLDREIESQPLTLFRPYGCLITLAVPDSALRPDIMILDRAELDREPLLWANTPIVSRGKTIPLIAEIVSSNWQQDYIHKTEQYTKLGIFEYWIVDPAGFGSESVIGVKHQPIVLVHRLIDQVYQQRILKGNDPIRSALFPTLNLTAGQLLSAV